MKVCFETFGCRLNRAEALQTEADYLAQGWDTTSAHADADLIVIRGCSVTARAQRDCEHLIAHIRAKYPLKRLIVTGCLPGAQKIVPPKEADEAIPTRTARAYLKIQDGCNGSCTFCIVPRFRGSSVSVPLETICDRARRFIEAGYHEIVITGCNLTHYVDNGKRLVDVLAALAQLCGTTCRIRLGSLEPVPAAKEVISLMAENAALCPFLHLPIQSASDLMLKAMRRPYSAKDVTELLKYALQKMPHVALGCDLISGFPGETDYDHLRTESFLAAYPFSKVHIFPYSERPGTPAATFEGVIPREIRHARAHRLAEISQATRHKYALKFLGQKVAFVVESSSQVSGWSSEYLWCRVEGGNKKAARKQLFTMRVTKVEDDVLLGVAC